MPDAAPVTIYTTRLCGFCTRAKELLERKGCDDYAEVRVDLDPDKRAEMMRLSGRRTVPQIWIGETHVGGFDELWRLDRVGQLDALLAGDSNNR